LLRLFLLWKLCIDYLVGRRRENDYFAAVLAERQVPENIFAAVRR
jgi:hypothetical protein